MPTYVFYQGRLIEKKYRPATPGHAASELPAPAVHSFVTYASPVDDKPVSSHRQRDRDLHDSGSYDPRDAPVAFRKARDVRYQQRKRPVTTEP